MAAGAKPPRRHPATAEIADPQLEELRRLCGGTSSVQARRGLRIQKASVAPVSPRNPGSRTKRRRSAGPATRLGHSRMRSRRFSWLGARTTRESPSRILCPTAPSRTRGCAFEIESRVGSVSRLWSRTPCRVTATCSTTASQTGAVRRSGAATCVIAGLPAALLPWNSLPTAFANVNVNHPVADSARSKWLSPKTTSASSRLQLRDDRRATIAATTPVAVVAAAADVGSTTPSEVRMPEARTSRDLAAWRQYHHPHPACTPGTGGAMPKETVRNELHAVSGAGLGAASSTGGLGSSFGADLAAAGAPMTGGGPRGGGCGRGEWCRTRIWHQL